MPRKGNVTMLITRDAHERLGHAGRGHVLARVREKYWIDGANATVRQLISSSITSSNQSPASGPEDGRPAEGSTDTSPAFHIRWCILFWSIHYKTRKKGAQKVRTFVHLPC